MNKQDLQKELSVEQRAAVAKIAMIAYNIFDGCKTERDVGLFFTYLNSSLQNQAINRVLQITGGYVEVVEGEPNADTVAEPA